MTTRERCNTMPSGACRQSDPRCNLLRREQEGEEKRKEEGDTRLYVRHNLELGGLTMKLSTTKRRHQPIVREHIFGGDIDAEKGMKYRKQCDTGSTDSLYNRSW